MRRREEPVEGCACCLALILVAGTVLLALFLTWCSYQ
jgi:hypothetical protein